MEKAVKIIVAGAVAIAAIVITGEVGVYCVSGVALMWIFKKMLDVEG